MTMPTTDELLAAISAHLTAFELPPVASVLATAATSAPVTVQLASHDPAGIAQGLLAWADTLTQATAHAQRIPRGNSVHLSVAGLQPRESRGRRCHQGRHTATATGRHPDSRRVPTTSTLPVPARSVDQ